MKPFKPHRIRLLPALFAMALPGIIGQAAEHWAFQSVPSVPAGLSLDALIERRLERTGLRVQKPASREMLLRRVHLDLTGLAPSPEELDAFLKDESSDAYEQVVDRLLASPHHGERWGRHWMDVWRYSDGYGLGKQLRNSTHHLWHWRDWIIESINRDKGYDRMILEMLAGDELAPSDPAVHAATGFLARNYYLFNRTTWLDDTIEHTGKAFLGLTFNCIKCHEHKYDPFEHADYYRLRAVFEPHHIRLDSVAGSVDFDRDGLPRVYDEHLQTPTYLHLKGDDRQEDRSQVIAPGIPVRFGSIRIHPVKLPPAAFAPGSREAVRSNALKEAGEALHQAEARLNAIGKAGRVADGKILFQDSFDRPRPDLWRPAGSDWRYRDDLLARDQPGREDNLISTREHPRDFAARLSFRTTGGSTYKSVGIRFDRDASGRNSHMIYLSAHAPDPKLQVAHVTDGRSTYPSKGRRSRAVALQQLHQLEIRVRDRLLNVFVDGAFQLAYALPSRGPGKGLELTAFDATVEFHGFELREFPEGPPLESPEATVAKSSDPEIERHRARLNLKRCQLALTSLTARIRADQAGINAGDPDAHDLATTALQAETAALIADLEYQLAITEDTKQRRALEAKLEAARKPSGKSPKAYSPLTGSRKLLETPEHKPEDYGAVYPRASTGRRLALAHWIASRSNPLTARVAVNHIWLRHFNAPLVDSVADFGLRAPEPLHRDVLDFLAIRFMEEGWSMKALHRRIVLSRAYRRTSSSRAADPETLRLDPDNRQLWRMNPRRIESQLVRDNLLHIGGRLDRTLGGPSVPADRPSQRRSIYFRHSRDDLHSFLAQFDDADFLQCYRRAESIVPQQALALSNSALTLATARSLADLHQDRSEGEYIDFLFRTVLGRPPEDDEATACREFLQTADQRRFLLAHALLNHNDFVTVR